MSFIYKYKFMRVKVLPFLGIRARNPCVARRLIYFFLRSRHTFLQRYFSLFIAAIWIFFQANLAVHTEYNFLILIHNFSSAKPFLTSMKFLIIKKGFFSSIDLWWFTLNIYTKYMSSCYCSSTKFFLISMNLFLKMISNIL